MSATSGTQASTNKGETTTSSSKSSKSGYDHLDINKLYKGKSTEPVAKTVTQKHGMQALGKALPARRGGSTVVKAEGSSGTGSTSNNTNNNSNSSSNNNNDLVLQNSSSSAPTQHQLKQAPPPSSSSSQYPPHHHPPPGWQQQQQNSSQSFPPPQNRPPGPQSPHHPPPPHHHPHHAPPPHHHHQQQQHRLQQHQSSSNAPNAAKTGGPPGGSMHDKNWSGGPPPDSSGRGGPPPGKGGNFPPVGGSSMAAAQQQAQQESMQRFAQEFPSLDSGGADSAGGKGGANANLSKNSNQDNQYGPGPILRPQTEGSWTQGGGRGMPRAPPGPPPPSSGGAPGGGGASSSTRDFGPGAERPNMGGPTPPPMSLGQGGHPPPPLGAFPMQFPPRPPYMYPNSGPGGGPPGGPGGFYPPGPGGMPGPRYGMPIPPGAPPPPSSHPSDGGPPGEGQGGPPPRRGGGRGPPPRPASHFASKPIIKAEELERMDELGQQDGGWATVQDDIDYNKKISFSDDEGQAGQGAQQGGGGGDKENSKGRRLPPQQQDERMTPRESRGDRDFGGRDDDIRDSRQQSRPMKILERPQINNDPRDQRDPRDRYGGGDPSEREARYQNDYNDPSNEQDDWKRKPAPGFDSGSSAGGRGGDNRGEGGRGPLSQQNRGGRMQNRGPPREEEESSWRSGNNNRSSAFDDDPRNKKGAQQERGPLSGRDRDGGRGGPPQNSGGGGGRNEEANRRGPPQERGAPQDGGQQRRDGGGVGGGGGGAGDFGPASGPFQSHLPPRLQRYHPPMFAQQQERNNQRKTPSPVPSGNAVNKERDFRDSRDWDRNDRNDRDRDREPQRPTYKILERNRGDSESSKESNSHRGGDRGSRFVGGGSSNNDSDSVPVRIHRDNKDNSSKRLSSDSGRLLMDDDSKMSPKPRGGEDLDSMDSSYDSLRGSSSANNKQDNILEGKVSSSTSSSQFRSSRPHPPGPGGFTSSWADEVDDDQDYNSSDMDAGGNSSRKGSLIRDLKRGDHQIHPEERRPPPREMPRRVIIQQTKVENMKSDVQVAPKEAPAAPAQQQEPKQPVEPVKIIEKPIVEQNKKSFSAWGDRGDSLREKAKQSEDVSSKDGSVSKEGSSDRDQHSSDKEGGKDGGKGQDHGKNDVDSDKGQGSREKLDRGGDRHYDSGRYGGRYGGDKGRDMGRGDRGGDRDRDRQKPRRMDSYGENKQQQQQRDNRTPDREYGGRSSQEKDGVKTGDKAKSDKDKGDKEDYRDDRRDDYDRGHRGGGQRGKERGGYGVYQPRGGSHSERGDRGDRGDRGGWGRDDKGGRGADGRSRGGRGGSSSGRDFYDKPRGGGRMEDRERGEKEEAHHHQDKNKDKDTASDLSNKGSVEDLGRDKGKGSKDKQERDQDKGKKSPGSQRRNNSMRGGARLQGYGPPSDKTPFSSGQSKEEGEGGGKREGREGGDGGREQQQNSKPAPVPLMALGDISPPNLQSSKGGRGGQGGREMGERGGSGRGGRGMPQRMQRDDYSRGDGGGFRGSQQQQQQRGGDSKGGRSGGRGGGGGGSGDAKPLMSINSNEVEGNEWESGESAGDSGEDDGKRGSSRKTDGGGSLMLKSGRGSTSSSSGIGGGRSATSGGGGMSSLKSSALSSSFSSSNTFNHSHHPADSANNNSKGASSKMGSTSGGCSLSSSSNFEIDCYSASQQDLDANKQKKSAKSGVAATSADSRESSNSAQNSNKSGSSSSSNSSKDRRIKNPPYEPRPRENKNNTWDNKTALGKDVQQQQPIGSHSNSSTPALQEGGKEDGARKSSASPATGLAVGGTVTGGPVDNSGPLKTMIFENTNFKSINSSSSSSSGGAPPSKAVGSGKGTIGDGGKKDGGGLGDHLGGFSFGKVDDTSDIGFGTFNESSSGGGGVVTSSSAPSIPPTSASSSSVVPKPIGQPPRGGGYSGSAHQPSPISPQAADLNEKVQSVKRIWEPMPPVSSMPSVQEQVVVSAGGDHQDTSSFHHGGFDTFKGGDSSSGRDQFGGPSSVGYAPGSSPALSAISKPESSSSPTSSNLRQMPSKQQQQQQQQVDSGQGHMTSSSPFGGGGGGYTMQPQGSNAFGGIPAVPSPPSVMAYGTSQTLHAAQTTGPHSGIYQAFPDAHSVMNAAAAASAAAGRAAGYGQAFPTHPSAAGSGQYGLFLSTPMEYQSMTSAYQQHQQSAGSGQGGGTSRISPGPMTTTGGGNSGVIISSTSSLMNAMKQQQQQPGSQPGQSHMGNPMSGQGYSQMSHHPAIGSHPPPHSHPQAPPPPHHLGPVGPQKPPGGYNQGGGLGTPSQTPVFIPFHDPNQQHQSVINLGGQNFLSSAISRGPPPGGPPPPQTPPVQALQTASSYYSGSSGNQSGVFPGQGSNQGGSLQQLHVAVAPNPQALQGYHSASLGGIQGYPTQLNIQGYNQQAAASTVSALNLNSQIMRNQGPPPQSHSAYMKQQNSMDLMGGAQLKSSHEQTLMNQNTWNTAAYSLNQAFHVAAAQQQQQQQQQQQGKAPGSNPNDNRGNSLGGAGNAIGGQRKGNNIGGGGGGPPGAIKYMSAQGPGGYSGQVQQQ